MSLPQVGDLVRLLHPTSGQHYETKGAMRSKVRVVWTTYDLDNVFCFSPIRLKVVNESR